MESSEKGAREKKRIFKESDFRIEQLKEEYFDELVALVKESFSTREPLICGLHLSKEEATDYLSDKAKEWIKCPASVCAIYIPENKIVGVNFNSILTKGNQKPFKEEDIAHYSPGVRTLVKILVNIGNSFNMFKQDETIDKILEIAPLTVDPEFSGNKLVYRMTEESERIARELGCQIEVSQATNKITQHIRRKTGFEKLVKLDFEDMEVDGVKPLDITAMNGNTAVIVFVKHL